MMWVSIEDGVPDDARPVVVWCKDRSYDIDYYGFEEDGEWYFYDNDFIVKWFSFPSAKVETRNTPTPEEPGE